MTDHSGHKAFLLLWTAALIVSYSVMRIRLAFAIVAVSPIKLCFGFMSPLKWHYAGWMVQKLGHHDATLLDKPRWRGFVLGVSSGSASRGKFTKGWDQEQRHPQTLASYYWLVPNISRIWHFVGTPCTVNSQHWDGVCDEEPFFFSHNIPFSSAILVSDFTNFIMFVIRVISKIWFQRRPFSTASSVYHGNN